MGDLCFEFFGEFVDILVSNGRNDCRDALVVTVVGQAVELLNRNLLNVDVGFESLFAQGIGRTDLRPFCGRECLSCRFAEIDFFNLRTGFDGLPNGMDTENNVFRRAFVAFGSRFARLATTFLCGGCLAFGESFVRCRAAALLGIGSPNVLSEARRKKLRFTSLSLLYAIAFQFFSGFGPFAHFGVE